MVETVAGSDSMCVGVSSGGPCEGGGSDRHGGDAIGGDGGSF